MLNFSVSAMAGGEGGGDPPEGQEAESKPAEAKPAEEAGEAGEEENTGD